MFKYLKWLITKNVSRSLSGVVPCLAMKSSMVISPLSTLSLTGVKSLSPSTKMPDKNKEISVLISSSNPHASNKKYSTKPPYPSSKVFWKATMAPFLHTVKLVQEKHTPCKVVRQWTNKEVSFQELSSMLSSQSKVKN